VVLVYSLYILLEQVVEKYELQPQL
jgi:hypothetical protein